MNSAFLPFQDGPYVEVEIAMRVLGVVGKKRRDEVLRELGVVVFRVGGIDFIAEPELNRQMAAARARMVVAQEAAK